jgi:hypothetical protein
MSRRRSSACLWQPCWARCSPSGPSAGTRHSRRPDADIRGGRRHHAVSAPSGPSVWHCRRRQFGLSLEDRDPRTPAMLCCLAVTGIWRRPVCPRGCVQRSRLHVALIESFDFTAQRSSCGDQRTTPRCVHHRDSSASRSSTRFAAHRKEELSHDEGAVRRRDRPNHR